MELDQKNDAFVVEIEAMDYPKCLDLEHVKSAIRCWLRDHPCCRLVDHSVTNIGIYGTDERPSKHSYVLLVSIVYVEQESAGDI